MEEKTPETPSVEPTLDGHYELSPMLSKMVEAELQDVMMKVNVSSLSISRMYFLVFILYAEFIVKCWICKKQDWL